MAAVTNGEAVDVQSNTNESTYVKEIQKNIRNVSKKLSSTAKTDAVVAENPGASLDDLIASKKINADQKAAQLKKPQLQAQLAQLEDQLAHYRKFETDSQTSYSKQTDELRSQHTQEIERVKAEAQKEAQVASKSQLKQSLLVFSQFLRAAAAKRAEEEDEDTEESKAFEGVLLLVYGGDQASVDAALKIIEGSEDKAPNIDGTATTISFAQIKQASTDHSPFQGEESWVGAGVEAGSDPTLVNAGLTEPQEALTNGTVVAQTQPAEAANAAAERWDNNDPAAGEAALEESYEVIPRPGEEVDVPVAAATDAPNSTGVIDSIADTTTKLSWDEQVPAYAAPAKPEGDGFQEVAGRSRGRGRGAHHGDGEGRGRGGRGGRGRGGFGGRGRGDGEHRGRGGRGRGRGDGPPRA